MLHPVELWAVPKSYSSGPRHLASFIPSLRNLFKILAQLRSHHPKNHKNTALCFSLATPRLQDFGKCLKQMKTLPLLARTYFWTEEIMNDSLQEKDTGREHFVETLSESPNTQEIQKTKIPLTLSSHGNDPACCSVSACLIKCTETFANEAICMLLFIFITATLGVPINITTLCLVQMSMC